MLTIDSVVMYLPVTVLASATGAADQGDGLPLESAYHRLGDIREHGPHRYARACIDRSVACTDRGSSVRMRLHHSMRPQRWGGRIVSDAVCGIWCSVPYYVRHLG